MDEAAWIAACKAGDTNAFNRLVLAHQQTAFNVALRMLHDADSAADATQDAFISAYTHIADFRGGSFKAWLLRILLNRIYDHLRKAQRHPYDLLEVLSSDEDPAVLQVADGGPTPEESVLSRELMACIESGLRVLPPDQRAVLILCDVQGFSYEETATATAANLGTVRSRLSRGRRAMRLYLEDHAELLPPALRLHFGGTDERKTDPKSAVLDDPLA